MPAIDGWDVVEQAARAGPARRGVRAGHRGLAAGPVVRPAGLARASSPRDGEIHGWIGGACAEPVVHPRGAAGDRRRRAPAAAPRDPRAVRRRAARRDDGHPDLLPERGRHGGVHRAGRARRPHLVVVGRSPMAHTLAELAARPRLAGRPGRRRRLLGGRASTPARSWWSPPRATATRRPSSTRCAAPPAYRRAGRLAQARARRCSATSPTAACPGDLLDRVRVPVGLDLGHTVAPRDRGRDPRRARAAARGRCARPAPAARSGGRRAPPRRSTRCAA